MPRWSRFITDNEVAQKLYYQQKELQQLRSAMGFVSTTSQQDLVSIYQLLGSTTKSEPVMVSLPAINAVTTTPTNQQLRLTLHSIKSSIPLTGVRWFQSTQGVYTANNYNGVGLYKVDSVTFTSTLVASSTNDGNVFKATSSTWTSKDFTTPYTAEAGLYFVGHLWNNSSSSTSPSFAGYVSSPPAGIVTLDFTNSGKLNASLPSQTSLPSSFNMSDLTASSQYYYMTLY